MKHLEYGEYSQNLDSTNASLTDDIVKLGYPLGLDDGRFWEDCKQMIHKRPDGFVECSQEERTELDDLILTSKERMQTKKRCRRRDGTFYNTGRHPAPQRSSATPPPINQLRPSLVPSRRARPRRDPVELVETECWCDCCK
jgi:hypothetical protein